MGRVRLFKALPLLEKKIEHLFKYLCTSKEIDKLQNRRKVCQILSSTNLLYKGIEEQARVSLTATCRVAGVLAHESHGEYTKKNNGGKNV